MQVELRDRGAPSRCVYCHDDSSREVEACPACGATCHVECFRQHGRCPTLGCRVEEPRARDRRAWKLRTAVWGSCAALAGAWLYYVSTAVGHDGPLRSPVFPIAVFVFPVIVSEILERNRRPS